MPTPTALRRWSAFWLLLLISSGNASSSFGAEAPTELTFERDIRPIFREFCFDCHGASSKLEGALDLRLVRFLAKGGEAGPAIVKGKPAESYLLERVRSGDMPPGEAHVPAEQIAIIERWVAAGAPTARPEPETLGPGVPISQEEREFWAFQPLATPTIPEYPPSERVRTPIDALLRQAMPEGLHFSPDADRLTLVRRLYFDVIGLPPSPEELQRWLNHPSPEWYPELVDELLNSPHYGERWARHWLDVAGYADSEGVTVADADRPWGWKYRDYVIRSLNADKSFQQFLAEQLAGDELAGSAQGDWTPEQIELLTATGFLRTAADGTGSGDNSAEARNKVMADTLKIVGNSLLGLSLNCAQCHDHRYDPIPQTDYFAIRAVFEPAMNWQDWKVPNQRLVSLYTAADRAKAAEIEAQAQVVAKEREAKQTEYMAQALVKELEKYEEPLRAELRTAYETAEKDRTPEQTALLDKHPSVKITPGVLYQYLPDAAEDLKKFDTKIAEIRATKPVEEFVRALVEPAGEPPVTRLFHRGDHAQPLEELAPAGLSVVSADGTRREFPKKSADRPTSGRRLAFAQWLTGPENPLTPRVIVNRMWMHHFGRGLVATPADFGKLGTEPSHPDVLDWLAGEFVRNQWSLKHLHRVILTSTAWRQSSFRDAERNAIDPENRYYWRKSLQRLEAEILRDRMLAASETLDRTLYGAPIAIKEDETGQVLVDGQQTRRSLYIRIRRTQPVAMLQTFDAPVMDINCEYRPVSTVATQSLMLLNGEFTLEQAGRVADRVATKAQPLTGEFASLAQQLPNAPAPAWTFATGRYDEQSQRTIEFTPLPHWSGSQWQGAEKVPAETTGWALLHAQGGHTGNPKFATVRRWTASEDGTVKISGRLHHPSENGDGVRGRIVSSSLGLLGEWVMKHGEGPTNLDNVAVKAGDTLDFVTDCIDHETSDSYVWTVQLSLTTASGAVREFDSVKQFHGPIPDSSQIPAQIYEAWQVTLCRPPSEAEFRNAVAFAERQLRDLIDEPRGVAAESSAPRQVLVNLCQMLLNSNEFVYAD